jgi:hypothetical protein
MKFIPLFLDRKKDENINITSRDEDECFTHDTKGKLIPNSCHVLGEEVAFFERGFWVPINFHVSLIMISRQKILSLIIVAL